jgi:hypothetical protein
VSGVGGVAASSLHPGPQRRARATHVGSRWRRGFGTSA